MRMRRCNYRGCRELISYDDKYCEKHKVAVDEQRVKRMAEFDRTQQGSLAYEHRVRQAYKDYNDNVRDEDSAMFYQNKRWRKLANSVRVSKGYVSDVSGKILRDSDTQVDHIVKRSLLPRERWYDRDNLWLLSRAEHSIKTNIEKKMLRENRVDELKAMNKEDWERILKNITKNR